MNDIALVTASMFGCQNCSSGRCLQEGMLNQIGPLMVGQSPCGWATYAKKPSIGHMYTTDGHLHVVRRCSPVALVTSTLLGCPLADQAYGYPASNWLCDQATSACIDSIAPVTTKAACQYSLPGDLVKNSTPQVETTYMPDMAYACRSAHVHPVYSRSAERSLFTGGAQTAPRRTFVKTKPTQQVLFS